MAYDVQSVIPEAPQHSGSVPDSIERAVGTGYLAGTGRGVETPFAGLASYCPIGMFDSGMGGLSILLEMRRHLPYEEIIYYADSANCPYGGRTDEWLRERSAWITAFLMEQGAKAVVVACNTASAAGLEHLRALYPMPVVGLVPAVKPAVEATRTGVIGVLATPATIRGRLLTDVIERFAGPAGVEVVSVAPDGWVDAVERGELDSPRIRESVQQYLEPMLQRSADTIVFGCTHYPFLAPLVREAAGSGVQVIDSGDGVSRQTRRVLEARGLLYPHERKGKITVYTSADPETVRPVVVELLGEDVDVRGDGGVTP